MKRGERKRCPNCDKIFWGKPKDLFGEFVHSSTIIRSGNCKTCSSQCAKEFARDKTRFIEKREEKKELELSQKSHIAKGLNSIKGNK